MLSWWRCRSVGLAPTKAKHLIALSRELLDRFDGQVPQTFEGLMSLPGVGGCRSPRCRFSIVMSKAVRICRRYVVVQGTPARTREV